MNEYIITNAKHPLVRPRYVVISMGKVHWVAFEFASVFRSRERAELVARKCDGIVEQHFGKDVSSTKRMVAPVQSKVNRHSAYRSI